MPPKLLVPDTVDELVLRFGELELGINVRRAPSPTGDSASWELVTTADGSTGASTTTATTNHLVSDNLVAQTIAATTAQELADLPLGFLSHLTSKLRGTNNEWSPQARIGRAFQAGVVASLRLEGQYSEHRAAGVPCRNSIYIILRAPGLEQGGWTPNYAKYIAAVGAAIPGRRDFDDYSISHSFATRAEGEAYLAGAGKPWPRLLQ